MSDPNNAQATAGPEELSEAKVEQQRSHFNSIAQRYHEQRQTPNHLCFKDLMWSYFFRDKKGIVRDGMTVLEPMCGYGDGKALLEKHFGVKIDYEGFDYSDAVIEILKKENPDIIVKRQDVTKYEPARQYDMMILIGSLHHVPNHTGDVLKRLAGGLKPGGFFVNYEPTQNNFIFRAVRNYIYKKNDLFDAETERAFDLEPFNDMFRAAGLKIVDQIYPGLLAFILYYNPDAFPFLNVGGKGLVRFIFGIDKLFFRNVIGRKLSFATITLLRKPQ
jgi:SAM-dependent methyltransferase